MPKRFLISAISGNVGNLLHPHGWWFLDQLDTYEGVARVDGMFGVSIVFDTIYEP